MTQSLLGRLRRFWLNVHLWLGVGLFVVLVPLGLSGSALVWDTALDHLLHPGRFAVTGPATLPASAYLDAARQGFGDRATAAQLRLPEKPGDPVIVTGRLAGPPPAPGQRPRTLTAWVDPGKGALLGVAETRTEFIGTMHALHGNLMLSPAIGRKVVGWLGWAMFLSSCTGLWLWWPRSGSPLKGLRWRRSPSFLNNLHHLTGWLICIPLALLSLTGVYIAFPKTSHALFGVAAPQAPGGAGGRGGAQAAPLAHPTMNIDEVLKTAQVWAPGAKPSMIVLPTKGDEPAWRIQYAGKPPKTVRVYDAGGEAEPSRGQQQGGQQDPVSKTMRDLHDGGGTGIVWQTIIFIAGIVPTVLGVSGIVMWLRRRERRRHLAHLAAE